MNDQERDELLIRVDERVHVIMKDLVPGLSKRLANHIKYHWVVSAMLGSALLGLIVRLLT